MIPVPAVPPDYASHLRLAEARPAIYARVSAFWATNIAAVPDTKDASSFWLRERKFGILMEAAQKAKSYELGWDGYNSPPPSELAIQHSIHLLNLIKNTKLDPYSVLPSADGGIGISFRGDRGRRAVLEVSNNGFGAFSIFGKGHPKLAGNFDPQDLDLNPVFDLLLEKL